MKLDNPKDVRELIRKFIMEMDEDGLKIGNPGAVTQMLNVFLRAWELEQNSEIEKRLSNLEKRIQEGGNHGENRQREFKEKA